MHSGAPTSWPGRRAAALHETCSTTHATPTPPSHTSNQMKGMLAFPVWLCACSLLPVCLQPSVPYYHACAMPHLPFLPACPLYTLHVSSHYLLLVSCISHTYLPIHTTTAFSVAFLLLCHIPAILHILCLVSCHLLLHPSVYILQSSSIMLCLHCEIYMKRKQGKGGSVSLFLCICMSNFHLHLFSYLY